MHGFRKKCWTNILYEYGHLSIIQDGESAKWESERGNYTAKIVSKIDQYPFPIAQEILEDLDSLTSALLQFEKKLCHIQSARLAFVFQEQNELVQVGDVADKRYFNALKIVIKTNQYGVHIDESWILDNPIQSIIERVDNLIESVTSQLVLCLGKAPATQYERRMIDVLMPPKIAGQFMHEALGHLLEADTFAYIESKLMKSSYTRLLTLHDDISGFERVVGLNRIDDEGTPIVPTVLLDKGTIQSTMNSTSHLGLDGMVRGFARAESAHSKPIPRMRMSITEPTVKKELSTAQEYIMLDRACNGAVLPIEERYVLRTSGYLMRYGEPVLFYPTLVLSANLFGALDQIAHVGSDSRTFCSDCIKNGQVIRVGYRSPSMYIEHCNIEGIGYLI